MIANEVKEELLAGEETGTGESDIIKAMNEWIKVKEVKNKLALESLKIHIGEVLFCTWKQTPIFWQ
ncbi:MAG TPA: hypothetical protein ACFYD0_08180 [Candidatus Wunengus sp. YC65]|uniref:hypothetical protein n=1 Tax=Candidatus Wunengus sp. YC65 TaxID=3367701 RepID=UPI00402A4B45